MARARDYSAEYARRIERATAKGKSRQQARGHVAREHVYRAQREIEEHGLTSAQMRSISSWVNRYKNEDRDPEEVIAEVASNGYEWFQNYRNVWNEARREYLKQLRNGTWATKGEGYLQMLADMSSVNELSWLYYH